MQSYWPFQTTFSSHFHSTLNSPSPFIQAEKCISVQNGANKVPICKSKKPFTKRFTPQEKKQACPFAHQCTSHSTHRQWGVVDIDDTSLAIAKKPITITIHLRIGQPSQCHLGHKPVIGGAHRLTTLHIHTRPRTNQTSEHGCISQ